MNKIASACEKCRGGCCRLHVEVIANDDVPRELIINLYCTWRRWALFNRPQVCRDFELGESRCLKIQKISKGDTRSMKQNRLKESVKNQLKNRMCANCSRPNLVNRRSHLVPRGMFCVRICKPKLGQTQTAIPIWLNQPKLGTCDQWQMPFKMKSSRLEAHKLKMKEKRLVAKKRKMIKNLLKDNCCLSLATTDNV